MLIAVPSAMIHRHISGLICYTVPAGPSHSSLDRSNRHCHLTANVRSVAICSRGSYCCCCCINTVNRPIHPDLVSDTVDWALLGWRSLCARSGESKEDTTSLACCAGVLWLIGFEFFGTNLTCYPCFRPSLVCRTMSCIV